MQVVPRNSEKEAAQNWSRQPCRENWCSLWSWTAFLMFSFG